jgi:hypothetical protein
VELNKPESVLATGIRRPVPGGKEAMRFHLKQCLGLLAIFIFAMAVWASTRTDSTAYSVTQSTKVGTTQLAPGNYTLKAQESQNQLRILHDGNLVATVPCQWVKLSKKANNSEVFSTKNNVTRVEFQGRREAIKVG